MLNYFENRCSRKESVSLFVVRRTQGESDRINVVKRNSITEKSDEIYGQNKKINKIESFVEGIDRKSKRVNCVEKLEVK